MLFLQVYFANRQIISAKWPISILLAITTESSFYVKTFNDPLFSDGVYNSSWSSKVESFSKSQFHDFVRLRHEKKKTLRHLVNLYYIWSFFLSPQRRLSWVVLCDLLKHSPTATTTTGTIAIVSSSNLLKEQ